MEIPEEVWPSLLKIIETVPSRRERIATAIIEGFLSNPQWRFQPDETAKAALLFVDALIVELDKKED